MKISINQLVMLCLGLFLLKITVGDHYRQTQGDLSRSPSSVTRIKSVQSRGLKGALVRQGRFSNLMNKTEGKVSIN